MEIQRLRAENFQSYELLDLNLSQQGLVLIEGDNRDDGGSNAAGKSTIFDALTYGAFGWTQRYGKSGKDVVRHVRKKPVGNTFVYQLWDLEGKKVEVFRYQSHKEFGNKFFLKIDDKEITLGSDRETQKIFEDTVHLDVDTFTSVVMYPQKSFGFASLTDAQQKEIFDKVLGLQLYAQAQERAKVKVKEFTEKRDSFKAFIDTKKQTLEESKKHLDSLYEKEEEYNNKREVKIQELKEKLQKHQAIRPAEDSSWKQRLADVEIKIEHLCADQVRDIYNQAVFQQQKLSQELGFLVGQRELLESQMEPVECDLPPLVGSLKEIQQNLFGWQKYTQDQRNKECKCQDEINEIRSIEASTLIVCPTCEQVLPKDKIEKIEKDLAVRLSVAEQELTATVINITNGEREVEKHMELVLLHEKWEKLQAYEKRLAEIQDKENKARDIKFRIEKCSQVILQSKDVVELEKVYLKQKSEIITQAENYVTRQREWERDHSDLKVQISNLEAETSPYKTLIEGQELQAATIEREILSRKDLLDYYNRQVELANFWCVGFGNQGVKSLLLDQVTPFLNSRANEYLQELRNTANLIFSTQKTLVSGEKRDKFSINVDLGNTDSYKSSSGGESARVDICVLLAMGDLAASRSLAPINLRLLDEPFESLDSLGCSQVVNLLEQIVLPRSQSVFVMSHNEALRSLFDKRITVVKQNGVSHLESN